MFHITIVLTDNACIRAETCVRANWWNLSFYNSKYQVENVPKQSSITRAKSRWARYEAIGKIREDSRSIALSMSRATLLSPLQNPRCFHFLPTHQFINSAFQTSCKVNCPKLMTKFNLVFAKCNMLLLTFEQTFTDGAVWLGWVGQKQWEKLFSIRGSFALLPWFAAPVGASYWLFWAQSD